MSGRRSIAVVVQRYGPDVGGGAEHQAALLADLLARDAHVTVLTTCAIDYRTWADHYPPGPQRVEGIDVIRFPVPVPRDPDAFDALSPRAFSTPEDLELGMRWMHAQGPVAPGLLEHLRDAGDRYDAVVFVTYLYATTVLGMPLVRDRAILVPELHDEPPARLRVFDRVFADARAIVFNTPEERDFAIGRFGVSRDRAVVAGVGVDTPPAVDPGEFARAWGLQRPYALCVGRLDPSKGTDALIEHHRAYRTARPDGADLVLMGKGPLALPEEPWLIPTGFVSDAVKHEAIAGAAAVVVPSPYESLSLVQLDAWSHGRPTLANAATPVLVGQSRRSGGGLWYRDSDEYAVMLDMLVRNPALAGAIGRQGRRSVLAAHTWDRVRDIWASALERVTGGAS